MRFNKCYLKTNKQKTQSISNTIEDQHQPQRKSASLKSENETQISREKIIVHM